MFKLAVSAVVGLLVIVMAVAVGKGLYEMLFSSSNEHTLQSHNLTAPKESGQAAFGAISEVVNLLEQKNTDWAKVDVDSLWRHLNDMNALMTHTNVEKQQLPNGLLMKVIGDEIAAGAMDRMIPAHSNFLSTVRPDWDISFEKTQDGYSILVTSDNDAEIVKIKALGFSGFMVQDDHHASHHWKIASGEQAHAGHVQ